MPSLLTHHYFASLVIEKYKKVMPFLLDHYSVVTLGAQGPDPFFFYGNAPFKARRNSKYINDFGSRLHAEPERLIDLLLLNNENISYIELSYLVGAVTHYVLDKTVHPYVFFHTGFDQQGRLVYPFQGAHAKFEVEIDVAVKKHFQLDPSIFHPQVTLGVSEDALTLIDDLYQKAYKSNLEKGNFYDAVKDMKKTTSFLYQASHLKRWFVLMLTGKKSLPFNLMHPNDLSSKRISALLNLEKTPYQDPVSGVPLNATFHDMIQDAMRLMDKFIEVILQTDGISKHRENAYKELIDGIDYDGKPIGSMMQTFVPFYQGFKK
jgi:hypothetical protein